MNKNKEKNNRHNHYTPVIIIIIIKVKQYNNKCQTCSMTDYDTNFPLSTNVVLQVLSRRSHQSSFCHQQKKEHHTTPHHNRITTLPLYNEVSDAKVFVE